ncbi:MAG: RNA polymerase sigma factor [Acidobacteriota bacterium]
MTVPPGGDAVPVAIGLASRETAGRDGLTRDHLRRLFADLAEGHHDAVEPLYRPTADRIYGLALWRTRSAEDAGDVVQEVFLRLVAGRLRLRFVLDPRAWLLGLAHHIAADLARSRKRRAADPLDEAPLLVAPERDEARGIEAARASRLLARLPPAQREAIYLKHFEDCTFREIGRITGVPTFTAASLYRLGIARLRRIMEEPS